MNIETGYRYYQRRLTPALRSKKTKAYGMLILSLLTASFFGIFAIRPTVTTIVSLRKEIQDNHSVEQELAEKIDRLTTLDQVYKEVEGDLSAVEAVLPSQPNFETLLSVIENTAATNQLKILSMQFRPVSLVRPKTEQANFELNPIAFEITLTGDYQNLISELISLNNATRVITIKTLEIKKSRGAPEEGDLVLKVGGSSFCVN